MGSSVKSRGLAVTWDPLELCRFCLRQPPNMRRIAKHQLPTTDIPKLFEAFTAIKLDLSCGYSELLCTDCEQQMREFAEARINFVRVALRWQEILLKDKQPVMMTNETNVVGDSFDDFQAPSVFFECIKVEDDYENDSHAEHNSVHSAYAYHDKLPHTNTQTKAKPGRTKSSTCPICGKTNLKDLSRHIRDHKRAQQFQCAYCPKTFCRTEGHAQHERTHTGERPFKCDACGFTFSSTTVLNRHRAKTCKGDRSNEREQRVRSLVPAELSKGLEAELMECDICGSRSTTKRLLLRHMRVRHIRKPDLTASCTICGKTNIRSMYQHMQDHRRAGQFRCTYCAKTFSRAAKLQQHERTHTGEKPFTCEQCDAAFHTTSALKKHTQLQHLPQVPATTVQVAGDKVPTPPTECWPVTVAEGQVKWW